MNRERFSGHQSAEELSGETQESETVNRGGTMEKKIITKKEAVAAVNRNALALRRVPDNLKTAELCLAAVKQYAGALCPLSIELGYGLISLVDPELDEPLVKQLQSLRKSLECEYGMQPPPKIHITDNIDLPANEYNIKINGVEKGKGMLFLCRSNEDLSSVIVNHLKEIAEQHKGELCIGTVNQQAEALDFVPEGLKPFLRKRAWQDNRQ